MMKSTVSFHIRHTRPNTRTMCMILQLLLFNWICASQMQAQIISAERLQTFSNILTQQNPVQSPCVFSKDSIYGGTLADCQGQGLEFVPSNILPLNTTTLLLQDNSIMVLKNNSFAALPDIKCLKISSNRITSIQPSAFRRNTKLIILDLECNSLQLDKSDRVPGGVFANLSNLHELRLARNGNDEGFSTDGYSDDLLKGLNHLQILTLDTFTRPLNFNNIFKNTPRLVSLTVTGGTTKILNDSFDGLNSTRLKSLTFRDMSYVDDVESEALSPLTHLQDLKIVGGAMGVTKALEILKPLANRTFLSLTIDNVDNVKNIRYVPCNILRRDVTRYLTRMCLQQFSLVNSGLMFVEQGALARGEWTHCLRSLDISGNPIVGNVLEVMALKRFKALHQFRFTNREFSFLNENMKRDDRPDYLVCLPKERSSTMSQEMAVKADNRNKPRLFDMHSDNDLQLLETEINRERDNFKSFVKYSNPLSKHNPYNEGIATSNRNVYVEHLDMTTDGKLWMPGNITYVNLNRMSHHGVSLGDDYIIKGGDNLVELHVSACGIDTFTGIFRGIESLQIVDISQNDGSVMAAHFFDNFPNIIKLDMSDMNLNNTWILNEGFVAFSKLKKLLSLDLSGNDFQVFSSMLLSANKKLTSLGLGRNRLNTIPVDLSHHPDMCLLDLRENSILRLKQLDIDMVEAHGQKMKSFSLWLQGNVFSCGCSNLGFLSWLQRTNINLDKDRAYSCILENGTLTSTQQLQSLNSLWRECNGKMAFLASLIIASFMLLGYCVLYLGLKFQTHLRASLVRFIGKTLPLKRRIDYEYDVYIGYSDKDVLLACQHLRHSIENRIGFRRTYIRDRDLIPASDIAESIVSAIDSSWRVLLVITEEFLQEDWSFLSVKWAIHSVRDSNPDRLVLIFTSHQLPPQRILTSLLKMVPETNIVYLTDGSNSNDRKLTSHEERMLENALCHQDL